VIVHVKLFATLRRQYPDVGIGEPMPVELSDGATIEQLIEHLHLPVDQVKIVFVNSIVQREPYTKLRDGDQVGIFPPVGGG
jgi:molybdopterin synthase sulfur carrier subunit